MNEELLIKLIARCFKHEVTDDQLHELSISLFVNMITGPNSSLFHHISYNEFATLVSVALYDAQNPSKNGKLRIHIGSRAELARSLGIAPTTATKYVDTYKHIYAFFLKVRDSIV